MVIERFANYIKDLETDKNVFLAKIGVEVVQSSDGKGIFEMARNAGTEEIYRVHYHEEVGYRPEITVTRYSRINGSRCKWKAEISVADFNLAGYLAGIFK